MVCSEVKDPDFPEVFHCDGTELKRVHMVVAQLDSMQV